MQTDLKQQIQNVLQETFKFKDFRPGQLEAITTLMQDGRLLCIQPTGHGKSLLYQLPSMLVDGMTLVISPLLALMRDQITQLKNRFNIPAASINTDQDEAENFAARCDAATNNLKILFIAPEQLNHIDKFDFLMSLPIRLLVIDEAHCISTWGHDFRPSYRQIIKIAHALIKKNPDIKLLGLTATANSKTEVDIKEQMKVDATDIVVHRETMNRENITLSVIQTSSLSIKLATLYQIVKSQDGCGLIYCATRENTELAAEYLRSQGVNAIAYHAGIDVQLKREIQHDFLHDKYPVISATNALGMGIDKSNLRYIIHFDYPGSITAYYQEVGRCGRDRLPAEGILFYNPADGRIQKHFIDSAQPTHDDFQDVLNAVEHATMPPNLTMLKRLTGMHPTKLIVIVAELIEQGFLKKISRHGAQVYEYVPQKNIPDLYRYSAQYVLRTAELKAMQNYAEQEKKCLMMTLRSALGDKIVEPCGRCSGCKKNWTKAVDNKDIIIGIDSWINRRTCAIHMSKKFKNVATGIAVLDGKLYSQDFKSFMRARADSSDLQLGIPDSLMESIKACLYDLNKHYKFSCIVPLPSRTWGARDAIVKLLANYLKLPIMLDLLYWQDQPEARQGALMNNDQRQHNVAKRMRAKTDKKIPRGTIFLFDDYTGSGATMNEAVRALRENGGIENGIYPFTIAAVKWRLGTSGKYL